MCLLVMVGFPSRGRRPGHPVGCRGRRRRCWTTIPADSKGVQAGRLDGAPADALGEAATGFIARGIVPMPLRWEILHDQRLVHVVAEGPVTLKEMEAHFDALVVAEALPYCK